MQRWPTWVEVDLDALLHNLSAVRGAVGEDVSILLTVKADAYGHGAIAVARAAADRVARFGVATVDEAIELDTAGTGRPILILSPILGDEMATVVARDFAATVTSLAGARQLSACAAAAGSVCKVHVEIDTGMGRTGVRAEEALAFVREVAALPGLHLEGLFTHFAVSDSDDAFTREQLARFRAVVKELADEGVVPDVVHSANSAALASLADSHLQMVRPGLIAYGHVPPGAVCDLALQAVLSWKTRVAQIRDVPSGWPISYGHTFATARPTRLGVLPVGYGHGYPHSLSNQAAVVVAGQRVPVIGRVTMDMTMVDLTDVTGDVQVEDEVVLIGEQSAESISVDELAGWANTISYEILCNISKRVTRVYLRDGRVVMTRTLLGLSANATAI